MIADNFSKGLHGLTIEGNEWCKTYAKTIAPNKSEKSSILNSFKWLIYSFWLIVNKAPIIMDNIVEYLIIANIVETIAILPTSLKDNIRVKV